MSDPTRPRSRKGGRGCLIAVVVLLVLLVVGAVAADRVAAAVAGQQASQELRGRGGLEGSTKVDFQGFPFLTQALARRFDHVVITSDRLTGEKDGRTTTLRDVHFDLHGLRVDEKARTATADRLTGAATAEWKDLANDGASMSDAGDGRLAITWTGEIPALGHKTIKVAGRPQVDEATQRMHLVDTQVSAGGIELPRGATDSVLALPVFSPKLTPPNGLRATGMSATPDGLRIDLTGENVPLGR